MYKTQHYQFQESPLPVPVISLLDTPSPLSYTSIEELHTINNTKSPTPMSYHYLYNLPYFSILL